jgi:hypothetical protein
MNTQQTFAILLSRLPRIDEGPGLILLMLDGSKGAKPPTKIGALTDAALRGRLAHFDLHSANEIAAVRHALKEDSGQVTVHESWPGLKSCLHFWYGFVGSQMRPIAWNCEKCGTTDKENIAGSVGESFSHRCGCGQVEQITVPK